MATSIVSCIKNDIPYPIVEAEVTEIQLEDQTDEKGNAGGSAMIDKKTRTIDLYVGDKVSLKSVAINKLLFTDEAKLSLTNTSVAADYDKFPRTPFASIDQLPIGADTRIDCSKPVTLRLSTYQDYDWTLNVKQIINREIEVQGQVGATVIDDVMRTVVIYVSSDTDLKSIKVNKFNLAGPNGTVTPNPAAASPFDFSNVVTLKVKYAFETTETEWKVYVQHKQSSGVSDVSSFPMSSRAIVTGELQSGLSMELRYRLDDNDKWNTVPNSDIQYEGTKFTATIKGLKPESRYTCNFVVRDEVAASHAFTTAPAPVLTDASFDNWSTTTDNIVSWLVPYAKGANQFWDSGNRGSATLGHNVTTPIDDDVWKKGGKAAKLASDHLILKFAAGSIYTGYYRETVDMNGLLDFGRPFTGFPTGLRIHYKYSPAVIHNASGEFESYNNKPDEAHIYIALARWSEPFKLDTREATRHLFSKDTEGVLAFGELLVNKSVPDWTEHTIDIQYYKKTLDERITPNYILVVASASKLGDYFIGGKGSTLYVDDFELLYE